MACRALIPETRNNSGIPHNDPHSRKTVNPPPGRGSFTNQEAPAANTTAEWKTTSPATTNPRIRSSFLLWLVGRGTTCLWRALQQGRGACHSCCSLPLCWGQA